MTRKRRILQVVTVSLVSVGCGLDTTSPAPCTGDVEVHVSSDVRPTISWSPACLVTRVEIGDVALANYYNLGVPDAPVWQLIATANVIESPVAYGREQDGATQTKAFPALPDLVVGRAYVAHVYFKGPGGRDVAASVVPFTVQ